MQIESKQFVIYKPGGGFELMTTDKQIQLVVGVELKL